MTELFRRYRSNFIVAGIEQAATTFKQVITSGPASAQFARVEVALTPLVNDLRELFSGGTIRPGLIIEHITRLREVKLDDVLGPLNEAQTEIQRLAADTTDASERTRLDDAAKALGGVAAGITNLRRDVDAALAPLRTRVGEVAAWYDTVMQSFEERYDRSMSWTLAISFVVVIYLNANLFTIFTTISNNDGRRSSILQRQAAIQQLYEQRGTKPDAEAQRIETVWKETNAAAQQVIGEYANLGFRPANMADIKAHFDLWNTGETATFFGDSMKYLFGWTIMALLLSLGAPFWHDTLESLFGLKNVLRKRSDQRTIEQPSGAGLTSTS